MIPLKQRLRHDPASGVYGDCHRAALASVLELSIDEVPHFCHPDYGDDWAAAEREWLMQRGYAPITMMFDGCCLRDVLHTQHSLNPDTYAILGGKSRNGTGHSVVICNGEIAHDPSLDDSGIVGPMDDGRFWVTFFGHAKAVRRVEHNAMPVRK
jgi:hypothetical protein